MKLNSLPAIVLVALSATRSSAAPTPVDAKIERELSQSLKRQLSSTRNDLVSGACKALTVIFARGTTEAGNVGSIAGPPFFSALNSAIGAASVAVQGVDYPADVAGFLAGGDAAGSAKLAALVSQASTQCPSTKIVISGYSQGGQLVHNAAKTLSAALTAKISAAVIFGDPDNGQAVGSVPASRVKIFCAAGDNICAGGTLILPAHLSYGANAGAAAAFVKQQSGL